MKNPIKEERHRLGITMMELAHLSNMSLGTIQLVEKGVPKSVPQQILDVLERLGSDAVKISSLYDKHKEKSEETRAE